MPESDSDLDIHTAQVVLSDKVIGRKSLLERGREALGCVRNI